MRDPISDLVVLDGGEAVTNSLLIAQGSGYPHKSVIRLVRDNLTDLAEFGGVRFENAPFETGGGTQAREVAMLNEQHATLLLTYMRNSDVVRQFKKNLVASFFQLRDKTQVPHSYSGALRLAADQHDMRQALELEKQALLRKVTGLTDKAAFHDVVAGGEDLYSVKEVAALLGTGQNRLMDKLRHLKWIDKQRCPYQAKLDAGLMDRKLNQYQHPQRGREFSITPMVTGKGLAKLQKLITDLGSTPTASRTERSL